MDGAVKSWAFGKTASTEGGARLYTPPRASLLSDNPLPLPPELQRLVDEEEALLQRTLAALASARRRARGSLAVPHLAEELGALKEEAATANAADLPHLFNQMDLVSAVVDRAGTARLANPHSPYFAHLRPMAPRGCATTCSAAPASPTRPPDVRIIDWRVGPAGPRLLQLRGGRRLRGEVRRAAVRGDVEVRRLVVIERGRADAHPARAPFLQRARTAVGRPAARASAACLRGGAGTAVRPGSLGVGTGAAERAGALRRHRAARRRAVRGDERRRRPGRCWCWAARAAGRRRWRCTGWRCSPLDDLRAAAERA